MKICKNCEKELEDSKFYYLGFYRKSGKKALSSYCKPCESSRVHTKKSDKPYKPHNKLRQISAIREDIIIDVNTLYSLIKKIEINSLGIDYIDSFRLVSLYTDIYGYDIPDYYSECEQLDVMFFKLREYIFELQKKNH